jgi:hypothetical protein
LEEGPQQGNVDRKIAWNAKDGITLEAVRSGKAKDMIGFQEIGYHIVFDIKMDIMRKARFVDSGHMMETLTAMMYSSVVLRGMTWIHDCSFE